MYMLLEHRDDEELAAAWFTSRDSLNEYVNNEIQTRRGAVLR